MGNIDILQQLHLMYVFFSFRYIYMNIICTHSTLKGFQMKVQHTSTKFAQDERDSLEVQNIFCIKS